MCPLILMPEAVTFHNTIFDIRCSKCKRTQENHNFVTGGRVFKTCNTCRERARVRRFPPDFWTSLGQHSRERQLANGGEIRRIPDTDDDSESEAPVNGLVFNYNDIDNVLLLSSSSAAAATCSSDTYFVQEPEEEPEPNDESS